MKTSKKFQVPSTPKRAQLIWFGAAPPYVLVFTILGSAGRASPVLSVTSLLYVMCMTSQYRETLLITSHEWATTMYCKREACLFVIEESEKEFMPASTPRCNLLTCQEPLTFFDGQLRSRCPIERTGFAEGCI